MLPQEYSAQATQTELDKLRERLEAMSVLINLVPKSSAPQGAINGSLAVSDGTGSGFDAVSGAGLYRYNGTAWVHIG